MRYLELSAADPALDLAIDEALLLVHESQALEQGLLRIWEPEQTMVVIGRGSRVDQEVNWELCQAESVPVLRRCSGGASVVGAPGCLMYSVVLSYQALPQLRRLEQAHQYVMERIANAVRSLGVPVELQGTCDLTLNSCKVSGNALRCRRDHLLYHGTLLYDMDLSSLERYLKMPPRTPDYRAGRSHGRFVACLDVARESLIDSLKEVWQVDAQQTMNSLPAEVAELAEQLANERYRLSQWTHRH